MPFGGEDAVAEGDAAGLYLAFGRAIYPPEVFEQSRELLGQIAESVTEKDLARFVILAKSLGGFKVTDRLSSIACPVLVLGSEDDNVLGGKASVSIYEALGSGSDREIYMYNGYGHAVYDLAPDYKDRMTEFFLR